MRHRKNFNHLGRTSSHRKAMLSNMASSLIMHKRIRTTVAKAKALRMYVEPLITKSKDDTTHSRRIVFSHLQNKEAVSELFREVSQKVADRPGGYTRILKLGNRIGDAAEMCYIELVDYNENMLVEKEAGKDSGKKRTRRGRSGKKDETPSESKASVASVAEEPATDVAEEPATDVAEEPATDVAEEPATDVAEEPTTEEITGEDENSAAEKNEK